MKMTLACGILGALVVTGMVGTTRAAPADDAPVVSPSVPSAPVPAQPGPVQPGGAPRPVAILAVRPAEGSRACRRPAIGADLRPTDAMQRTGTLDASAIRLALDGRDVSRRARIVATATYPLSRISISYLPGAPLALGKHRAVLTIRADRGQTTYAWEFIVADIPCR